MTKGPSRLKSGWPKDKRPPKRGKSGSPLATGNAQRLNTGKAGTSPAPAKPIGEAVRDTIHRLKQGVDRLTKGKKPKKVSYTLISPDSREGRDMYAMLNRLVEDYHEELTNARIALAWNTSWKPDVDGRVTLGKCKKASDLDRELAPFDFVILLRAEFWQDASVNDDQRRALMDHELCHASVKLDEAGEPVYDDRGRVVYRSRKHDIEEFEEVVRRHGCYKRDLERFAAALKVSKQPSLPLGDAVPLERVASPKNGKAHDVPAPAPPVADDLDNAARRDLAESTPVPPPA